MKRIIALLMALCLLVTAAAAESAGETRTVELSADGLTVYRCKSAGETAQLAYDLNYPAFEAEDKALTEYLTQTVAQPLMALQRAEPMSADPAAYEGDKRDNVRMIFFASMDFPGLLSVVASVANHAADESVNEMLFFTRIVDLRSRRELSVYDLFAEPPETVDAAIRSAVFATQSAQGLAIVADASQVPAPDACYLSKAAFRCLYGANTVAEKASVVDIPWVQLGLTATAALTGNPESVPGNAQTGALAADGAVQPETDASAAPDETGSPTAVATPAADAMPAADGEPVPEEALTALLTAHDWTAQGHTLRFLPEGGVKELGDGAPLFYLYYLDGGRLYLSSDERPDQAATVTYAQGGLLLTFDPDTSDLGTLTLLPAETGAAAIATATPASAASLPPLSSVITPTPMPVEGEDADLLALLTQGLWKKLGTEGDVYYQFTADGKLLTIQVSPYTVTNGELASDALAGTVEAGGTAFTLVQADGQQVGFVLNRAATAVPVAEFVTPSPTPAPTPSAAPTPTAAPTVTATPSPTPAPTPTLSPYEQAVGTAPTLAALGDASFAKRQTLKVYSAPDEGSYRNSQAQVTTDETVQIFGVTGDWVLVSYKIGNGSRGRIGYIANTTLADAGNVAQLAFVSVPLKLTKKASATDDPLSGKGKLFDLKKDAQVTLLAFLGSDWAYVETTYKGKPCRVFIPRAALMSE